MKLRFTVFTILAISVIALAQQFSAITPSGAVTGCPAPTSGVNILCSVTDGYYASVAGAGYVKMTAQAGGGVATYNGRTGNVLPAAGDYTYSQLSSPPTSVDCASWAIAQNGHLSLTSCTIK